MLSKQSLHVLPMFFCRFKLFYCDFTLSDQLSRLHMILKPFMLRRIKKDVENALSDKVNVL